MTDLAELKFPCPVCGNEMKFIVPASDVRSVHITNADRLRAMTDEELAEWHSPASRGCPPTDKCKGTHAEGKCYQCWLDWLRQEASDG